MSAPRPDWYWVLTGTAGTPGIKPEILEAIRAASAELERMWKGEHLMTRAEVAAHLGIAPESVRSSLRPYGISAQDGYPRALVESLQRHGRGRRTDLKKKPS